MSNMKICYFQTVAKSELALKMGFHRHLVHTFKTFWTLLRLCGNTPQSLQKNLPSMMDPDLPTELPQMLESFLLPVYIDFTLVVL